MKQKINTFIAVIAVLTLAFCGRAQAAQWKALILPASLNTDKTIKLIADEMQVMTFTLQADKDITSRGKEHDITLEWDLPAGMSIVEAGGVYAVTALQNQESNGRNISRFSIHVDNKNILGVPGSSFNSDWQNDAIFVRTPPTIPAAQSYIGLKVQDGDITNTFRWQLELSSLTPPAQRPKLSTIGLWDYNYMRAKGSEASNGIAKFLQDAGITFTELARNDVYRKAMQDHGVTTGGFTHHDFFFSGAHPNYRASGVADKGGFADPQYVIDLPPDAAIPGVKYLLQNEKENGGFATFDYEPNGIEGFSPASTAKFKTQYNISDADFTKFQQYVAAHSLKTFQTTDPLIKNIWKQWVQFRSDQTSNYVRRIYQDFKAQAPHATLAITPSRSYGRDALRTLALGCDNSAMAQYADIIMPQLYSGYGAANAKLVMQMTAGWRQEIEDQHAQTQLWPLLLVRYSGAGVHNSPQRLYQQMIGSLAQGANGILFYYPSNMNAPYWEMLAQANEVIAKYEDFYQNGKRVDEKFPLSGLPVRDVQIDMYPYYQENVKNPDWSFTAHQLGTKVLLTFINLDDTKEATFSINTGKMKVLSSQNAEQVKGQQWQVAPGQVGFILMQE